MTTKETLVKYLTDMHALEKHVAQPIKSQADDADFGEFPEARQLVQRIEVRTQSAISALEILIKQFGAQPRLNRL